MRREILYFTDILEAADHIAVFISGMESVQFLQSELVRSSCEANLLHAGDPASSFLSTAVQ